MVLKRQRHGGFFIKSKQWRSGRTGREISFLPDLRSMLVVGIVEGRYQFIKSQRSSASDIKEFGFSDALKLGKKTSTTVSGQVQNIKP
ncbi:MAG: hypothetical protein IPN04_11715 [Rhodoferax sp.]|nr:hypothetical protein [Rhodoferax sp.]